MVDRAAGLGSTSVSVSVSGVWSGLGFEVGWEIGPGSDRTAAELTSTGERTAAAVTAT